MSREVLATDIDEVLFPFVAEFSVWHNQEYGTDFSLSDFTSYEFEGVLGISVPETVHRIHTFLSLEHGHLAVSPLEQAQEAIAVLGDNYQLAAVTARHPQFESPTLKYVMHHFNDRITDITLVGHKETMDVVRTKAEVCEALGAVALIDDSLQHVLGCSEAGIGGVLFGNYPWNQVNDLPEPMVRANDWPEVLEHFGV